MQVEERVRLAGAPPHMQADLMCDATGDGIHTGQGRVPTCTDGVVPRPLEQVFKDVDVDCSRQQDAQLSSTCTCHRGYVRTKVSTMLTLAGSRGSAAGHPAQSHSLGSSSTTRITAGPSPCTPDPLWPGTGST
jgi:hypothetical protein